MAFTKEELEDMQHELKWSGTDGLNIDTQRELVDQLLDGGLQHGS